MKKRYVFLLICLLIVSACSNINYTDRVKFCEDKGMSYSNDHSGGFTCAINDIDYIRQDIEKRECGCKNGPDKTD